MLDKDIVYLDNLKSNQFYKNIVVLRKSELAIDASVKSELTQNRLQSIVVNIRQMINAFSPAEKIGSEFNNLWKLEREFVGTTTEIDLFYVKARELGVWGGRPFNEGMILIMDSLKRDKIMSELCNGN